MTFGQEIEIERLRNELEELQLQELIEPFVQDLLETIGVSLATTPFADWPKFAQVAFGVTTQKHPAGIGWAYQQQLPKKE